VNYRRGLRRLYLTLAAAWFLVVLFMVATDHWLWTPWNVLPVTWGRLAKERGVWISTGPPVELSPKDVQLDQILATLPVSPLRIARNVAALALPLPILGYVLLFWVWPWIYRGFRPTAPAG
jgi:hypothetical protein